MLNGKNNEEKIWNYLTAVGFNACGAAGIMGNLRAESGLRPNNVQNCFEKRLGVTDESYTATVDCGARADFAKDGAGYGIAQWTYWSRKQALWDFAKSRGVSISDLEMQLDFLVKELTDYGLTNRLKNAGSVLEASNLVLTQFEKPAGMNSPATQSKRAEYGQSFYDEYAKKGSGADMAETTTDKTSAAAVIAVAASQIGYREKASNAQLDSAGANAGSANYTKYARDFDQKYPQWYNGKKNGFAWCDMFVDWCFLTAFGYEAALQLLCQPERSAGAGCTYSLGYYRNKGQFYTSGPKPGDQIFFGKSLSDSGHTGLVEKVESGRVHTIEGNTSNMVARRSYALTDKTILGYGRPAYDTAESAGTVSAPIQAPVSQETTVRVQAAKHFNRALAGAYRTTADLNLRTGAGTGADKAVQVVIPKGGTVQNYGYYNLVGDQKWLYVQYAAGGRTYTGYCSMAYLTK